MVYQQLGIYTEKPVQHFLIFNRTARNIPHCVKRICLQFLGIPLPYPPKVGKRTVPPQQTAVTHFVKLRYANSVFIGLYVLCHNIHRNFAKIHICAYSRSCGYAGFLQHIRNHCACKLPRRHFIGVKIMRCVYKNLVHAVGVNILGCDIFKIYIVNFNAYFFIKRHSRLCGYEFKLQFRVSLKLLFIA